jgi:2-amino-4-hydroxy-6-hydroxymethyldihydropteridine diphosphokinase
MASALIALGGNVGDPIARIDAAIAEICRQAPASLTARSANYETPPWGGVAQASFVNACIAIATERAPRDLLATLQDVERMFGRDRARETRWGPRTLDLDIIAYDDIALDTPDLTLPHPRLFERAFVLVPLADIAPDRVISGRSVREALSRVSKDGIVRLPDLG